ncbi:hypothetical protein D3C76_899700 [compost metagenome]|uniref:abortive infection system antitoxin AbiGi family protein n=1 Tax=Pseudomonas putida TaxID=303 RepID=UPI00087824A1|nr:abortive infection system antitoxin AbiGi family protein [Pseudomonas putida]AOX08608.1 hypothetical protein Q5O_09475 [Pseudomonas putida JB]
MHPKSNTLFHFTKSSDTLKHVLKSGFWPRYCPEDVSWVGYEEFDYIAYPMVCFCEIPLSRLTEHVGFYGSFGLGLTREWAAKNGLNPVFYTSPGSPMATSFKSFNELANRVVKPVSTELKTLMRSYLSFSKPTAGTMIIDSKPIDKAFYQESEWRYVAQGDGVKQYLLAQEFSDPEIRDGHNKVTYERCLLKFTPADIKYIFVREDSDIPDIVNFIQTELDAYPGADLKILMSRVTSLESIRQDL